MARIKKSLLVMLSGRVGDVVFKSRRGNPYVASMPSHYTIPDTDYYRKSVSSFSFAIGFSSALNKIKLIRAMWVTPKLSAFEEILSSSLRQLRRGGSFEELSLVPERKFFQAAASEIQLNNDSLFVTFEPLGGALSDADRWISMQGVICLENPSDENERSFRFVPFASIDCKTEQSVPITFDAAFSSQELSFMEIYNSKKIILNLITKSLKGETRKVSINITESL